MLTHCNADAKIPNFRPSNAAPCKNATRGRPPRPLPAATVCNTFTILLLAALKLFAFVAYVLF